MLQDLDNNDCALNILKIHNVFYYYENNNQEGDVTEIFTGLFNKYLISFNDCNKFFIINNEIFGEKAFGIKKTLYVNVVLNNFMQTIIVNEYEKFDFEQFLINVYNIAGVTKIYGLDITGEGQIKTALCKHYTSKLTHLNFVGMGEYISSTMTKGEIISNYCMYLEKLKLKSTIIFNKTELCENNLSYFIKNYPFFIKLLCNIHEKILLSTQSLDNLCISDFNLSSNMHIITCKLKISYDLYIYNKIKQKIINYFDIFIETKSEDTNNISDTNISCYISINDEECIYSKIAEINFLSLYYDTIYFDTNYKTIIQKLFKNPNIFYDLQTNIHLHENIIILSKYTIDITDRHMFEFAPIVYEAGGKLGDFINQLSIINEMFYETGRKGILYIKELLGNPDNVFSTGYVKTFQDTYHLITSQKYISDYKIYNEEKTDIDLSSWRQYTDFYKNWKENFQSHYRVDWGNHEWLTTNIDDKWKNVIVVNITPYRFIGRNTIARLKTIIDNHTTNSFCFISFDENSYKYFVDNTGINIPLYKINSIEEAASILKSCTLAYLGLSAIQAMCNALHKEHILLINKQAEFNLSNIKNDFKHIIDIYLELL